MLGKWSSFKDVVALENVIKVCIGCAWWVPPILSHFLTSGHCAFSFFIVREPRAGAVILNALAEEMVPVVTIHTHDRRAICSIDIRFPSPRTIGALPTDVPHL